VKALLLVETRRVIARRLVKGLVILALAGIALAGIIAAATSHRPSPDVVAAAERQAADNLRECLAGHSVAPQDLPPNVTLDEFCRENIRTEFYYSSNQLNIRDLPNWIQGASFILFVGALVVGASFVGAEWHAGTMTTLLTWEPRRLRVLAAKAVACVAVVFLLAAGLEVVLSLALALVAKTRGITSGLPSGWFRSVVGTIARVGAAAAAASALGLALAMIGRNAAAAMGVSFGYLAIVEGLIRGLKPQWQPWLFGDNLNAFILGGGSLPGGRSVGGAALVLGVYLGVLLFVAAVSFRVRDVN